MSRLEIKNRLEQLIRKAQRASKREPLPVILLFGQGGALDSVAALRLTMAIESEFGISIEDEEITAENFTDLETLTKYVEAKLKIS
jgi:acyl carrier protein